MFKLSLDTNNANKLKVTLLKVRMIDRLLLLPLLR